MIALLYRIPPSLDDLLNRECFDVLLEDVRRMEPGMEQVKLLSMIQERVDRTRQEEVRNLLMQRITSLARRIAGGAAPVMKREVVPYQPGLDEIDVDRTLEEHPHAADFTDRNIFCFARVKQKSTYVLMLDASNSMHREKIAVATIAVGVFACKLQEDFHGVLTFDREARVIKRPEEPNDLECLVWRMLEIQSGGATDIREALRGGLELLGRTKTKVKTGILVSDGWSTVGGDPAPVASKYDRLHVLGISFGLGGCDPAANSRIARRGRGRYLYVNRFSDLPMAILRILSR